MQSSTTKYIRENFCLRKCARYVQVNLDVERQKCCHLLSTDCVCGQSLEWHAERGLITSEPKKEHNLSVREIRLQAKRLSIDVSRSSIGSDNAIEAPAHDDHLLKPPDQTTERRERVWTMGNCTVPYPCDAFGEFEFEAGINVDPKSIAHGASAKYIRLQGILGDERYKDKLYYLMSKLWKMPKPQLIIEVTGSALDLPHVEKRVVQTFNEGLIQAARNANAWLVTGGTNCGVMRLVGEAVTKYHMSHGGDQKITCLGIVSWGIVNNRDRLIVSENKEPTLGKVKYPVNRDAQSRAYSPLDPGHNYFLLVDNGKEKRFAEEIEFRAEFTAYLTKKLLSTSGVSGAGAANETPLVLLVIGGGPNTLATVEVCVGGAMNVKRFSASKNAKEKEREEMKRPVVILSGFGGAADLLATAYQMVTLHDKNNISLNNSLHGALCKFPPDFDEQLRTNSAMKRLLGDKVNDAIVVQQTIDSLKRCLCDQKLITVVDIFNKVAGKNDLEKAILHAIFKAKMHEPRNLVQLFHLAQNWNQDESAKLILQKSFGDRHSMLNEYIIPKRSLDQAIQWGQTNFFELLVEFNVIDFQNNFSREEILSYYSNVFITRKVKGSRSCVSFFSSLLLKKTLAEDLAEESMSPKRLAKRIGNTLSHILGCTLSNPFAEEYYDLGQRRQALVSTLIRQRKSGGGRRSRGDNALIGETTAYLASFDYKTKWRDLFLFSLLLKRSQFATAVWRDGTEHLCTALMGSIFLKRLGDHASLFDMHDLAEDYKRLAGIWQGRSIEMLTRCYDTKPEHTFRMLTRSLTLWQGRTTMEIAYYGNEKRFIANSAIQAKLNQIWHGRIATFTPAYLIYAIALVPVFLWPLAVNIQFLPCENSLCEESARSPDKINNPHEAESLLNEATDDENAVRQPLPASSEDESDEEDANVSLKNETILLEPFLLFRLRKSGKKFPRNAISLSTAIRFIYQAPMVKYMIHSLAMAVFLLLLTFFILTTYASTVSVTEVIIWIWSFCMFMQEFHSHFTDESLTIRQMAASMFSHSSGIIVVLAEVLMIVSMVLRAVLPLEGYVYPHTTYSLCCLIYWIDALRFFYVIEALGPKVITLFKMFQDLIFFLVIYTILLFAFSVSIHALIHPRQKISGVGDFFAILLHVVYQRWWHLLGVDIDRGEVEVDDVHLANGSLSDPVWSGTEPVGEQTNASAFPLTSLLNYSYGDEGKQYNVVAVILLIMYLFLTNIMLLNMLIAMLSLKVEETQADSQRLWRFSYFRVVTSFYKKRLLPAPLNIFLIIYDWIMFYQRRKKSDIKQHSPKQNSELKVHFDPNGPEYTKLDLMEQNVMSQILRDEEKEHTENGSKCKNKQSEYDQPD